MPEIKEGLLKENEKQLNQPDVRQNVTEIKDLKEVITVPRGLESWMQKIEDDPTVQKQKSNNGKSDDSILQPIATTVTKISLPVSKRTFLGGFSKPIDDAWKWLSEFYLRIIKKNKGNVKFKEE
jgi:hypothetical protein